MGGMIWPLRLEVASLGVGEVVFWEERMKRAGPQRERDGGGPFLATADSIKQQYPTAFCALRHTRSCYKPAIYHMNLAGCRSMPLRKCMGGGTWPLRLEVASLRVGAVVFWGRG